MIMGNDLNQMNPISKDNILCFLLNEFSWTLYIVNYIIFRKDFGKFFTLKDSGRWILMEHDWLVYFSMSVLL